MLMLFQLNLGAKHPAQRCAHAGWYGWLWGIAIGVYKRTVVFGMLGHEIDKGLETCAATSGHLYFLRRFEQCLYLAQICVELHDVYLLYSILEEAIDGGVEILEVIG